MIIKSAIFLNEIKNNTLKRNYNESEQFYPVFIFNNENDISGVALFTEHEIKKALERGNKNPEDVNYLKSSHNVSTLLNENTTKLKWWERLLFWL